MRSRIQTTLILGIKPKVKLKLTRHQVRILAFQALFMLAGNHDLTVEEAIAMTLDHIGDQPLKTDFKTSSPTKSDPEHDDSETESQRYLRALVAGVNTHQRELDDQIRPKLKKGWTLGRLSRTDLVILRLGLYELSGSNQVPQTVALNEAIQLAKEFSDDQAAKFINAVLANFLTTSTAKK